MKPLLPVTVWCILLFIGCKTAPKKEYEKAVLEWTGKTVVLPDSMCSVLGENVPIPESKYTIVAYFDSVGCTGCRMKLPKWEKFMTQVDSIGLKDKVSLLLVSGTSDTAKIRHLVRQSGFRFPVIDDSDGEFITLNKLPDDSRLHTFLLDHNKRVVIIGNPTQSKEMRGLYLNYLSPRHRNSLEPQEENQEENIEEFDFGTVKANESVSHCFTLTNIYPDTLRIEEILSSCECTAARVSSREIAPGDSFKVTVTFRDSIPGEFLRSVTLKYQDSIPGQILEISGTIE